VPQAKTAVDADAKSYWSDYFGPYGKDLTRDIPRRVLAYLHANKRIASAAGAMRPLALVKRKDGFTLEVALRTPEGQRCIASIDLNTKGVVKGARVLDRTRGYSEV